MTDSQKPLIQMVGVKKVFLTDEVETHALSDVHLEIQNNEFITIAGPSGGGKSTLLSIMGLLDTPTGGQYHLKADQYITDTAINRTARTNTIKADPSGHGDTASELGLQGNFPAGLFNILYELVNRGPGLHGDHHGIFVDPFDMIHPVQIEHDSALARQRHACGCCAAAPDAYRRVCGVGKFHDFRDLFC